MSSNATDTAVMITNVDMATDVGWSWKPFLSTWSDMMHLISAVLGIIGNLLVLLALWKRRASTRSTDRLIGALALADFLTSIFIIPLPGAKTVPSSIMGEIYCKMVLPGLFLFVCFTSSIYILMAISIERYMAVVYPLVYGRLVTRRGLLPAILVFIWFSTFSVYFIFVMTVVTVDPGSHKCILDYASTGSQVVTGVFYLIYRLILPTVVMLTTQILIARSLHLRSARYGPKKGVSFHVKARNRVLQLMLIVILVYIICWGPGQIVFFLYSVGAIPPTFIGSTFHTFVIVLTAYNSCLNPIIYVAWFPEFRSALKQVFNCNIASTSSPIFDQNESGDDNAERRETMTNI
ncbi:galanin receptor 2a-like [Lytechinus pictus]|uniref:galanin receptor 2a-like n=1 Tax=Lytechinus pictus TaxID=7653 RepID=UPI0030B9BEEB